jgi:2-succinyl-6-hydroxy-2,4-cyclohexadiene-1-carboxylate synthase
MIRAVRSALVLLHGFAGTRHSWEPVIARLEGERYRPVALDLRGHGDAADARPVTFAACVADVLAATAGRFALCGYSMGGRLALHVALAAPERVTRLVLLSTAAGIDDAGERATRARADAALAADLERGTIDAFADRWTAQPLFAGTPPAARAAWREDILRNHPAGLAAALRGVGAGVMEPLWDRLGRLELPATVAAGERDARYVALAQRLAHALPNAELVVVPGAGHGLPREAPAAVARLIGARVEA